MSHPPADDRDQGAEPGRDGPLPGGRGGSGSPSGGSPGAGGMPGPEGPGGPVRDPRLAGFAKGGAWDGCPPSAVLAAVAEEVSGPGWRCPGASDDELAGLVRGWAAVESWASAGKLGVVGEMARREIAAGAGSGWQGEVHGTGFESLYYELSVALAVSVRSAETTVWLARELRERIPGIGALLADGTLTQSKARGLAEELSVLSDVDAAQAEALIVGRLAGKTPAQLGRLAALAVSAVDPEGVEKRRKAAQEDARVRLWREQSGAAAVAGYGLPPDEALAAFANVGARAGEYKASKAFKGARMDQLRAMAYLDLLNGVPAAARIARAVARAEAEAEAGAAAEADGSAEPDGSAEADGSADADAGAGTGGGAEASEASGPGNDGDQDGNPRDDDPADEAPCGDPGSDDSDTDDSDTDDSDTDDPSIDDPDDSDPGPDSDDPDDSSPGPDGDGGPDGDDGPGNGGGRPGGPSPSSGPVPEPERLPALQDLIIPLLTLLGLARRPGEGHGLGALDPGLAVDLAAAAALSRRSQWCVTITDADGIAIGHGCARPARTGPAKVAHHEELSPGLPVAGLAAWPARVNLTIPLSALPGLSAPRGSPARPGSPGSPGHSTRSASAWSFTPRDDPGPPGGHGVWALVLPGGRELTVSLGPVPVHDCDHRHESNAYQPNATLRHLVQVRDGTCTFPPCSRHARESDFEHAVPYDQGGRTCACNAGARSRRCHRVKQSKGWNVTQPRPGWHQWTTPTGRTYTQGPKQYPA